MKKLRKDDLEKVFSFMPKAESDVIRSALKGEEKRGFELRMQELYEVISSLPKLYEQDGKGGAATAWLHYFHPSGSDWLITEFDGNRTFFGFACLSGNVQDAEYGYVDLEELRSVGAELELYFNPRPLCIAKGEKIFGQTAVEVAFDVVFNDDVKSLRACLAYGVRPGDSLPESNLDRRTLEEYVRDNGNQHCRKIIADAKKSS